MNQTSRKHLPNINITKVGTDGNLGLGLDINEKEKCCLKHCSYKYISRLFHYKGFLAITEMVLSNYMSSCFFLFFVVMSTTISW